MYKIFIQLQADVSAFFRVELRCKDIIAGNGATERCTVFCFADHMAGLVWNSVKTVDEIEKTLVGYVIP